MKMAKNNAEQVTTMEREAEARALSASPIACAVADAWQKVKNDDAEDTATYIMTPYGHRDDHLTDPLQDTLDALELATRNSPLRKVKP